VLSRWFDHVQRDQLDSLRPLLAPDFLFVSDGERVEADPFVTMIKSLGISHPRVQFSSVVSHESGTTAHLVYDRVESFEARHDKDTAGDRNDRPHSPRPSMAHRAVDDDIAALSIVGDESVAAAPRDSIRPAPRISEP
jgi:hypothetical protein